MFGVLAVIPEFSSPDVRDVTDTNTLLKDIHSESHQTLRSRPDHHENRKSRIIVRCVETRKKTVFLKHRNYVISHVITPYITLLFYNQCR